MRILNWFYILILAVTLIIIGCGGNGDRETRAENLDPELLWKPLISRQQNQLAYDLYVNERKIYFDNLEIYEPWSVPENPLWDENPFNNISWSMYYQSLIWLYVPAYAYDLTSDSQYLNEIVNYIFSWIDSNSLTKPLTYLAWNNHAVAYRTAILVYLYHKYLKEKLTAEQTAILFDSFKEHGNELERLINDPIYEGHNHGIFYSLALYDLAVSLPELSNSRDWKLLARSQINTLIDTMVEPSEGVSKEQAFAYHYLALSLFCEADRFLSNFKDGLSGEQKEIFNKMIEFGAILMWPNNMIPATGDTNYGKLANLNFISDLLSEGFGTETTEFIISQGENGIRPSDAYFYPTTGYAIFRPSYGDLGNWSQDLTLVSDMGPSIWSHGHNDTMNFMLYAYGTNLIIDSGGPYIYGDSIRKSYFLSSKAHNTVVVDKEDYQTGDTAITRYNDTSIYSFIEAEHSKYLGITHRRTIMLLKPDLIIVIDNLISNDGQNHIFDLLYHFPPNTTIELNSTNLTTWSGNSAGISMLVESSSSISSSIVEGQEEPYFQGWVTPSFGIREPAPVVQFRQEAKQSWFLTLIKPSLDPDSSLISSDVGKTGDEWEITVNDGFKIWSIYLPKTGDPILSVSLN